MEAANANERCPLDEMPEEILVAVIACLQITRGFLPDPCHEEQRQMENRMVVKSLHSLTMTCRKLARVTTPFLYQSFIQTWTNLNATWRLLRTFIHNPELAQHLQYLENHTTRPQGDKGNMRYDGLDLDKLTHLLATANWDVLDMFTPYQRNCSSKSLKWTFSDSEQLESYLWGNFNLMKAYNSHLFAKIVLISLADNLSEVATIRYGNLTTPLAWKQVRHGLKTFWLKHNNHLHFAIDRFEAKSGANTSAIQDYLRLAYSSRVVGDYLKRRYPPFQTGTVGVELDGISFDIYDCEMHYVEKNLHFCRLLRQFTCRWVGHPLLKPGQAHPGRPTRVIELPVLRQALSTFTTCLEYLTIDTLDSEWQVNDNTDIPAIGSLRDFTALKNLDVSGIVLFGDYDAPHPASLRLASMLPESLEHLNIDIEWDDDIEEALHVLLPECSSLLPNLKKIRCTWRPAPKIIADYLVEAFQDIGVELILSVED